MYYLPQTWGDWLHFTKELVLKLHFLFVVGTETKCIFWGKQKRREVLQSPPRVVTPEGCWLAELDGWGAHPSPAQATWM